MTTKSKAAHFSMRIEEELKSRLHEAAKAEGRATANLVILAIRQYLDQHHPQPSSKPSVLASACDPVEAVIPASLPQEESE